MRKLIYSLLCLLSAACLFGCSEKILEAPPVSSITSEGYWKAEGDVVGYMTGIYDELRGLMNATYHFEDRGDEFVVGLEGPGSVAWEQNLNDANAPVWLDHYNLIHHTNLLLKYGPGINFVDQKKKDRLLAEAHFVRAFTYFLLIKSWNNVPLVLEPTESDDVPFPKRIPATEIMSAILDDIEQAISLFPDGSIPNKAKVSRQAAYALKADALLWKAKVLGGGQADLEAAITAVDNATPGLTLVMDDFSKIFATNNKNNSEILFSIHFQRDERSDQYGSRMKPRDLFVNAAVNRDDLPFTKDLGARSVYAPSPKIQNLFSTYPNDKRASASIIRAVGPNNATIGWFDNKFKGTFYADANDRMFDNDIIVYRLAELILFKAEALAALNRVDDAVLELNKVRGRAGIGDYTGAKVKATVEKEILNERGRELYFELKRWPDLVRFHYGGTIKIYDEVPKLNGTELPLFFPIRATMINLNPALTQTDGYIN